MSNLLKDSTSNLLLDLTPSEVGLIRSALRAEQENHKRNGFKALESAVADLRDKVSNAMIANAIENTRRRVL